MSITKLAVAAAAFSLLSAIAAPATSVIGTWKGKLKFDASKLPHPTSPQQAQMLAKIKDQAAKMVFVVNFKKDGTYAFDVKNGPVRPGAPAPKTQTGKWSIKGDQLTVMVMNRPQVFTVAKNGKSFTSAQGNGGSVTFTR